LAARQRSGWVQPPSGGLVFCPPVWGPVLGPSHWPCTMAFTMAIHSGPSGTIFDSTPLGLPLQWLVNDKTLCSVIVSNIASRTGLRRRNVSRGCASFLHGEALSVVESFGWEEDPQVRSEHPNLRAFWDLKKSSAPSGAASRKGVFTTTWILFAQRANDPYPTVKSAAPAVPRFFAVVSHWASRAVRFDADELWPYSSQPAWPAHRGVNRRQCASLVFSPHPPSHGCANLHNLYSPASRPMLPSSTRGSRQAIQACEFR